MIKELLIEGFPNLKYRDSIFVDEITYGYNIKIKGAFNTYCDEHHFVDYQLQFHNCVFFANCEIDR